MKSRYASAAVVVALLLPFTASALSVEEIQQQIRSLLAQLATLQEQIRALQSTPATVPDVARGSCPALFRALSLGTSGSDVLSLQKFLVAQNLLSAEAATGSFEALTQGAVQGLQTKYGVVLSGTPGTTGYGAVGPRTRALIALNCNLPGTTSLSCPFAPPPTTACSTGWQANTDANGCTTSYKCSIPQTTVSLCPAYTFPTCSTGNYIPQSTGANGCPVPAHYDCTTNGFSAPTITSVDGPATLKSGERGTWTVRASTPNQQNTSIKYSVTWGDEYMAHLQSAMSAQAPQSITTSGTFTHAYSFVGAFSPRFTVSNDSGSASFTTSVQVSGDSLPNCQIYMTTMDAQMSKIWCPTGQRWEAGKPTYDSNGCMIPGYGKCVPDVPAGSTFSASPTSGSAPLAVVFSSNVGGGITPYRVDYTIDYGDGVREAAANCYAPSDYCISPGKNTHTYTNTGTYTATLTMTKYNNCQATGDSVCAAWVSSTGTLGTVTITVGGQTSSASLNISSPNAGQSYAIGQNMTISWNSTNAPAGSEARLYLLNSKGQYVSNGIGSGQSSASYQWTVPSMVINTDIGMSLQPGSYRIEARLIPSDSCVVMHPGGGCRPGTTQRDPYAVTSSGMFSITASAGGVKCKEDLTALDAYNASQPSGTACGQGGPSLRCPYDSSVVYGSLNTCATGFLQQRGWVSVSSSGNTNTNLANALSALEALLKKFLGQ